MARTTLTYTEWLKKVIRHPTSDQFAGLPVPDVMEKLDVSKQRVHQLIDSNALDAIVITTKKGATAMVLVTQASLDFYLAHRTPFDSKGHYTFELTA